MAVSYFMIAVLWLQALSCGYAMKRSFTLKPTTTKPGICASNPCVHGHCQPDPSMNTYVCKCIHGATGRNCQKEIDVCSLNPCVFGTCSGHGVNFTCTCHKGYTGKLCNKEIDMCLLFNPCAFGTCSGHGAQYTCTCDKGWRGKLCDSKVLPVNGRWASWTTWSTCTRTCGTGSIHRARSCSNPAPQNNGAQCSGSKTDTKSCNSIHCPVDGGWTYWTTWSTCTRSCGTGSSSRTRTCTNPTTKYNGAQCSGSPTEYTGCNYNQCPGFGYISQQSSFQFQSSGGTGGIVVNGGGTGSGGTIISGGTMTGGTVLGSSGGTGGTVVIGGGTGNSGTFISGGTMTGGTVLGSSGGTGGTVVIGGGTGNSGTFISGGTMTGGTVLGSSGGTGGTVVFGRSSGNSGTFISGGTMTGGTVSGSSSGTMTATGTGSIAGSGTGSMTGTGIVQGIGTATVPGTGCVYNSHLYRQGEKWKDGCKFSCQCIDRYSGYYACTQLCPQWQLPSVCHMNSPAPGKCCQTPSCPAGIVIQYPPGYTEQ